jgi:uncharacterized LabA/DUF88 family protein
MPIPCEQTPEVWFHTLKDFITSCGYVWEKFFAIGNWRRYESKLLRLVEHVIAIDVNDSRKQAADMVIIQAIQEETVKNISETSPHTVFIITGDSDFTNTVKSIQSRGYQVFLIHGNHSSTSKKLLEAVNMSSSINDVLGNRRKRKPEDELSGSTSRRKYK